MKEIIRHTGHFNILYSDYVEITGDACAAQLLSSLEYWTKCKLYVVEEVERQNAEAAKNNAPLLPVPELWLYEKIQDFVDSICGTFKRNKVLEALKLLKEKGFVESKPSPNPWDKTCFWRMNIKKIQDALDSNQVKGFEPEKTKSPRARIQTLDSLDSNLESLDSDLESLDSNLVESLNSNSHPYMIQDLTIIQSKNSIKDPPTPQGGMREISNSEIFVEEGDSRPEEEAIATPLQEPKQEAHTCQKHSPPDQINVPPGDENHSRFATDTTAENMNTWNKIVATGAMKGERSPNPEFQEFYRQILSKTTQYKGRDCNLNHAKAALSRLWKQEPDRILAEAESWVKSKIKSSTSTQTRDAMSIPREERLARARAIQEAKQAQQQAKGA